MISVGVAQWSLDRAGCGAIERAATLGFEAVHVDAGTPEDKDCLLKDSARRRFVEAAESAGIRIRAIAANGIERIGPLGAASAPESHRCVELVRGAVEAAAEMSVPMMYVPSFGLAEIHDDAGLRRTADLLRSACEIAEGTPVRVATENTLGDQTLLTLIRLVDHPKLCVLVDIYNAFLWGHDPCKIISAARDRMADDVHVKDGTGRIMGNALLGEGDGNFASVVRFLLSRFSGTLIVENDYREHAEERARHDLAAIRAIAGEYRGATTA
jgi:L-ribulose-5-phosphate 3-epimerase